MNLIKDIQNLQDLSVGEHPLQEVLKIATSSNSDTCTDCGGGLIHEYDIRENETWTCIGCGNTWST